jgi:transposase
MKRIPQGRYSKEFREEAVKLVIDQDLSIPEVSRRLDVPKSTISNWVKASKAGKLGNIGKNRRELSDTELTLARLKRELAQVKMERDILKKAAAYFAKESI